MPIVTMPDGTSVEMPDTITPELAVRLRAMQSGVKPEQKGNVINDTLNKYLNKPLAGIGEAALSLGTGLGASAVGGIRGLSELATGGSLDAATQALQETQQGYTYQPRTNEGKSLVHIAGIPFEVAGQVLGKGGQAVGGAFGGQTGANIGQSVGEALPGVLGTVYGGGGALQSAKGATINMPNIPIVSDITKVFTPAGKRSIAEEGLSSLVPKSELPQTIAALEQNAGGIVPGSPVTTAEALARANAASKSRFGGQLVRTQEDLSKIPETSAALNTIKMQQEAARAKVLQEGSGTEATYNAAMQERASNAAKNYGVAEKEVVKSDTFLSSLLETPAMQAAANVASKIAANEQRPFSLGKNTPAQTTPSMLTDISGKPLAQTTTPAEFARYPISSLQDMKMALDKMIAKPESFTDVGINAADVHAMRGVRAKLINWLENKSEAYTTANAKYAIDSVPINQMDLWRALQEKFIAPTGKESPGVYLRTLRDETKAIKDATGLTGKTSFKDIFNTEQSALAARLATEMEMELVKNRIAGEVNVPGIGRMAEKFEPNLPNFLSRTTMVTNFILKHLAKGANKDVNIIAAEILADPQMLASVLKQFNQPARKGVMSAIKSIATNKDIAATLPIGVNKPLEISIVGGADSVEQPEQVQDVPLDARTEQSMKATFGDTGDNGLSLGVNPEADIVALEQAIRNANPGKGRDALVEEYRKIRASQGTP